MTDKALSFVGPIITAYNAAEKAGADALRYAVECGKHLHSANETVTAEKGKCKAWREKNLPTVSEETERVYRRLAVAVAKKEDIFVKCKSIRDAIKHLSRFDEDLNPKPAKVRPPKQPATGSSAGGLAPPEHDTASYSVNLIDLTNIAPDEVVTALVQAKWDTDKVEDLILRLKATVEASRKAASRPDAPTSGPAPHRRSTREMLGLGAN